MKYLVWSSLNIYYILFRSSEISVRSYGQKVHILRIIP